MMVVAKTQSFLWRVVDRLGLIEALDAAVDR
jgi:hypothetical protein